MARQAAPKVQKARTASTRYNDLVRIATELFARDGYERTTVRAIADEMGIESGSLYSHISSKEDLLLEIVVECGTEFFRRAELARSSGGSAEEILRALGRAHMSVLSDTSDACRVYFDEWRKLNAARQATVASQRVEYEAIYRQTITDGIADGAFRSLDVSWAALVVLSTLNWTSEWFSPDGPLSSEEIADSLLDVVLPGFRAPSAD